MIQTLLSQLDESTCNFMAVARMARELEASGFHRMDLADWDALPFRNAYCDGKLAAPHKKYYCVRNDSALFAIVLGEEAPVKSGFRIVAAHSDSPCFKLKPNPEIYGDGGTVSLNVEKYGGGIMYTWFDRPLSISGRVALRTDDPMHPEIRLVDLKRPVAVIPHLAIHFNRAVNEGNKLSVQKDMKPVIGTFPREEYERAAAKGGVVRCLVADSLGVRPEDILSSELCLYPVGNGAIGGVHGEYLESPRIDDLSMAFTGLQSMLSTADAATPWTRVLAVFDNEETGSGTRQGAASPVLRHLLESFGTGFASALEKSFLISADDAHAWHPNYNDKYDPTNHPVLGGGPVIKINANCKYMTDARSAAVFAAYCEKAGVNCQWFVNHGDVAGGSTLGNILTAQMDISGVDVGCAIWAMHSACETASVSDHEDMKKVFECFFQ